MGAGVFGKLPARRDYIQHDVSGRVMELMDPWLQGAVAQSRDHLGGRWLEIYLQAPIWRFWLGPRMTGKPVLGAIMPSVDGVGRYFPLCILGEYDLPIGPPEVHEQPEWFDVAESIMLGALADNATYEAVLAGLPHIPEPRAEMQAPPDTTTVAGACAMLRLMQMRDFYGQLSYWWVPSPDGGGTPPRALMRRGLPSPAEYAMMIAHDEAGTLSPALGGA